MARDLVVHGVTVEEWCTRYGITPFSCPCRRCGKPRTTSIPFVRGTLRGLVAPRCCETGNQGAPYCVVRDPKAGDLLDGDLDG